MKKLLSLMLAMMMLAMPVLSLADGDVNTDVIGGADAPTGITVSASMKLPGELGNEAVAAGRRVNSTLTVTELKGVRVGDPEMDAVIADLLDSVAVVFSQQGDEYEVTLQLAGKEAASLGVAVNGKDAYISSDLMGKTIVVNETEAEELFSRLMNMLVRLGAVTEDEAAQMIGYFGVYKAAFAQSMASSLESPQMMQEVEELVAELLIKLAEVVADNTAEITEIVVPRMCDPAVAGRKTVLTNEDVIGLVEYLVKQVLTKPAVKGYLATEMGVPAPAVLEEAWETYGAFYMAYGYYESKEAYMASQPSVDSTLNGLLEELRGQKLLGGEMVVAVYTDAEDKPVYVTATVPFAADEVQEDVAADANEAEAAEETPEEVPEEIPVTNEAPETAAPADEEEPETVAGSVLNAVYTRQSVPGGVAHVCNIGVDGTIMTVDVFDKDGGMTMNVSTQTPGMETMTVLKMTAESAPSLTDEGVTEGKIDLTAYTEEAEPNFHLLLDGEWAFTDVRSYLSGALKLTSYIYDLNSAEVEENTVVLELSTDSAINGVDFSGISKIAVEAAGIRMGMQGVFATADPEESIMAGQVIRPAELDDAAFTKWFISVIRSLNLWQAKAINTLPDSLMEMILFSEK